MENADEENLGGMMSNKFDEFGVWHTHRHSDYLISTKKPTLQ